MQQRPPSAAASRFCMCGLVLCGSSAGQSRRRKGPLPSRQRATWLSACRQREKRPSSSTRQANEVGRISRRARLSHLILVRLVTGEPRIRLEHKIPLHEAASEVRYIVNFNNDSTTEPNGVSELSLAPHRATVLTNRHSPAELARKKSRVGVGCAPVPPALAARPPLAVAEQDHQLRGAKIFERECCLLMTCRQTRKKKGAARIGCF
jgi:hypothetical protein